LLKPHTFYRDAAKNVVLQEAIEKMLLKTIQPNFCSRLQNFGSGASH
jgi:hypothetical protein